VHNHAVTSRQTYFFYVISLSSMHLVQRSTDFILITCFWLENPFLHGLFSLHKVHLRCKFFSAESLVRMHGSLCFLTSTYVKADSKPECALSTLCPLSSESFHPFVIFPPSHREISVPNCFSSVHFTNFHILWPTNRSIHLRSYMVHSVNKAAMLSTYYDYWKDNENQLVANEMRFVWFIFVVLTNAANIYFAVNLLRLLVKFKITLCKYAFISTHGEEKSYTSKIIKLEYLSHIQLEQYPGPNCAFRLRR
jgi:hypothetical protein